MCVWSRMCGEVVIVYVVGVHCSRKSVSSVCDERDYRVFLVKVPILKL